MRHNEILDGVADLVGKDLPPSHMHNNPLIFAGCDVKSPKVKPDRTIGSTSRDNGPPPEATEYKGCILICDLWKNGTGSVHDIRVVNTDANSNLGKQPKK